MAVAATVAAAASPVAAAAIASEIGEGDTTGGKIVKLRERRLAKLRLPLFGRRQGNGNERLMHPSDHWSFSTHALNL